MRFIILTFAALVAAAPKLPLWGSSQVSVLKPAISTVFNSAPISPQILDTLLAPNEVNLARNTYITREGSTLRLKGEPYTAGGANVYWLGLDENGIPPEGQPFYAPFNASYPTKGRITEVMNTLVTLGAKTIRSQTLGVSVGNPLSLMPSLGTFNDAAFDSIDWAIFQAREHGLRLFIPLTDNYDYYHGGKFSFLRFRGYNVTGSQKPPSPDIAKFYTDPLIISDFKSYIQHLLTHVNPYTGLTYAEDPTILAYETGNELSGVNFADIDVPVSWTTEIAKFIKSLAPNKLVSDGTYGINTLALGIPEVDIYDNHFYPVNVSKLEGDIEMVRGAAKVYLAGEYDWVGKSGGDGLEEWFAVAEANRDVVAGSMFWSLFMHDVPDCSVSYSMLLLLLLFLLLLRDRDVLLTRSRDLLIILMASRCSMAIH